MVTPDYDSGLDTFHGLRSNVLGSQNCRRKFRSVTVAYSINRVFIQNLTFDGFSS